MPRPPRIRLLLERISASISLRSTSMRPRAAERRELPRRDETADAGRAHVQIGGGPPNTEKSLAAPLDERLEFAEQPFELRAARVSAQCPPTR